MKSQNLEFDSHPILEVGVKPRFFALHKLWKLALKKPGFPTVSREDVKIYAGGEEKRKHADR